MLMNKKKKMTMKKLPSFFKSTADDKSSWPWPSCRQPRTLSFRTNAAAAAAAADSSDSFTLFSESSGSLSTASDFSGGDPIERMIRGLRPSERLRFEPTGKSSSILKEEKTAAVSAPPLKQGTTVLAVDSDDPFWDFRKSMEEMVEAHGIKDWEKLEELLNWYFRVNGRNNHGFILAAFVDLLVTLSIASSSSNSQISQKFEISDKFDISDKFEISPLSCSSSSSMEIEEITSLDDEHHHHHVFS